MELTVVVSVLGLDCAQHSSRIATLNGDHSVLVWDPCLSALSFPSYCVWCVFESFPNCCQLKRQYNVDVR